MSWGDSETVSCVPVLDAGRVLEARIYLFVEYSPIGLTRIKRGRVFKFVTETQADGTLRWIKRMPFWTWGTRDDSLGNLTAEQ